MQGKVLGTLLLLAFAHGYGQNAAQVPAPSPEPTTPASESSGVGRSLSIEELPLIENTTPNQTQTPQPQNIPKPVTGGDGGVNPFAPLVLPQPETPEPAQTPTPKPTPAPTPTPKPTATPAPTPEPAAPETPAPVAAEPEVPAQGDVPLPAVNSGTSKLSATVLRRLEPASTSAPSSNTPLPRADQADRFSVASTTESEDVLGGQLLAIRMPSNAGTAFTSFSANSTAATTPLGLRPSDRNFTSTYSNRVSRELSTKGVAFTAMTTGTGIFRMGESASPVTLVVGDALPGTKIVLSKLTSSTAQFSQDDVRHTLLLNP